MNLLPGTVVYVKNVTELSPLGVSEHRLNESYLACLYFGVLKDPKQIPTPEELLIGIAKVGFYADADVKEALGEEAALKLLQYLKNKYEVKPLEEIKEVVAEDSKRQKKVKKSKKLLN